MIYCCKALDECCQGMFDACGKCCQCCNECCESLSNLFDRPFSCWALFCFFLLGGGGIVAFIYAGKNWGTEYCEHNLPVGLLIIGICYFIQNFANFYIVYKYSKEYGKYGEFQTRKGNKDICQVTCHFLCYDFFMCFYIFFLPFSIIWCSIYLGYSSSNTSECKDNNTSLVTALSVLGICYLIYVGIALCAFLCQILCLSIDESPTTRACCSCLCCGYYFKEPKAKAKDHPDEKRKQRPIEEKKSEDNGCDIFGCGCGGGSKKHSNKHKKEAHNGSEQIAPPPEYAQPVQYQQPIPYGQPVYGYPSQPVTYQQQPGPPAGYPQGQPPAQPTEKPKKEKEEEGFLDRIKKIFK